MYRYNSKLNTTHYYDPVQGWTNPKYVDPDEVEKPFVGILMGQYDPLIEANNIYNNLIIEMKIVYNTSQDVITNLSSVSKTSLANNAIIEFNPSPSTNYYLSRFVYIQLANIGRINHSDNTNIYHDLTEMFDDNQELYPLRSFYLNDVYTQKVDFGDLLFSANSNELYLYFNISYYEEKIIDTFSTVWDTNPSIKNTIYLFQDVTFLIRE